MKRKVEKAFRQVIALVLSLSILLSVGMPGLSDGMTAQAADTFVMYFVAPDQNEYTVQLNARKGSYTTDPWVSQRVLTNTGETYYGRPIYAVTLTYGYDGADCPWGGFGVIQFVRYNGSALVDRHYAHNASEAANQWFEMSNFANKMYDASTGTWIDYAQDSSAETRRIYFDATLSKLDYSANELTNYSMPKDGTLRYYATGTGLVDIEGNMSKAKSYTDGANTWNDVYYVDVPVDYTQIVFSAFDMTSATNYGGHGESTATLTIPTDTEANCFYADTSDQVLFAGGTRGGYWGEVYTVRDAEAAKESDIVDIVQGSFQEVKDTLYLKTTFFDYYTDFELNGTNRDSYKVNNGASWQNWYPFRQLNQALSDYYKSGAVQYPLYVGHFQPSLENYGYVFEEISGTLDLYGYSTNKNRFFAINNGLLNGSGQKENDNDGYSEYAIQGLIHSQLANDTLMAYGGSVEFPLFNADFIKGGNSKNTVLGEVYENVSFPFTREDSDGDGVEYWEFDSSNTTLAMRYDADAQKYYLVDAGDGQTWSENVDSGSTALGTYGFFPFNETATSTWANTYNFGYGVRIDLNFRLTEDGTVLDNNGNEVPIKFEFSGDDDVWVFIDGELVLDVGGSHSRVDGSIDFKNKVASVDKVKSGGSSQNTSKTFALDGENTDVHTLTMFYMERGMWESNMKITFNFPDENLLEVEKQVDDSAVNELFEGVFDNQSLFSFIIKNLATHFGSVAATGETHDPISIDLSQTASEPSYTGNTFEYLESFGDKSSVLHWYAELDDEASAWRHMRYGVLTLPDSIDVSDMSRLSFSLYYDDTSEFSLNDLYLQLVDKDIAISDVVTALDYSDAYGWGCIGSASSLAGKTYGTPETTGGQWVTITLDLAQLDKGDSFDLTEVRYLLFGSDVSKNIYISDIHFEPTAKENITAGFITQQYEIPDYGSATSGALEFPEGAIYTSSLSSGKAFVVGGDGRFVLQNSEVVGFHDQFRRGSYIYLEEVLTEQQKLLFDTSWTMYENGMPVTGFGIGTTVTNPSSIPSMQNVISYKVTDGRTEKVLTGSEDGNTLKNAYNGTRPGDTFVFRSYGSPDSTAMTTKLRVVFTNVVNTGSLTISKATASGSDALSGSYTFYVEFYNVGGLGLENNLADKAVDAVTFTLKSGESYTIDGIPLGTEYRIYEVKPTSEDAALDYVQLNGSEISFATGTWDSQSCSYVSGVVSSETADAYTFYNAIKPVVSFELTKKWGNVATAEIPGSILLQLQRSTNGTTWTAVPGYENFVLQGGYIGWEYTFENLDQYDNYASSSRKEYSYRVVELDSDGNVLDEYDMMDGLFTVFYDDVTTTTVSGDKVYSQTITNSKRGNHVVVIDFGLPVEITVMDDFVSYSGALYGLGSADKIPSWIATTSRPSSTNFKSSYTGTHGTATISGNKVKYTPSDMEMNSEDVIAYVIQFKDGNTTWYYYSTVTVIPATTIYYEDSFVSYAVYNNADDSKITASGEQWKSVETTADKTQAEDRPGTANLSGIDVNNLYGYDGAYTAMNTYSLDSSMMVNVDKDKYAMATFTFWGTGFDIISMTTDTTGTILVDVFKADEYDPDDYGAATPVEYHMVDTYYGYKWAQTDTNDNGRIDSGDAYSWIVDPDASDDLYQIPVIKVNGLDYGKYTAVITVSYFKGFDHGQYTDSSYDFYLDAIRIYDPANDGVKTDGTVNTTIQSAYTADGEGWPEYFELRNLIISKNTFDSLDSSSVNGIVFIDNTVNQDEPDVSDYVNYGPNNELYLAPGQSIAFELNVSNLNVAAVHMAMKSVGGSAEVKYYDATKNVSTIAETTIATATDLYYDITDLNGKTVVITNTGESGDAILSITNIKVTYKKEHTDSLEKDMVTIQVKSARMAVASLMMPVVEESEVETTEAVVPEESVTENGGVEVDTTETEENEGEAPEADVTEGENTEADVTEGENTEAGTTAGDATGSDAEAGDTDGEAPGMTGSEDTSAEDEENGESKTEENETGDSEAADVTEPEETTETADSAEPVDEDGANGTDPAMAAVIIVAAVAILAIIAIWYRRRKA